MKRETKQSDGQRYSGPVIDKVARLNSSTRRAGVAKGVLQADKDGGMPFAQLLRAGAWAELARFGITRAGTRDDLLDAIVSDMQGWLETIPTEPRYLVACAMPDLKQSASLDPSPVLKRVMDGFRGSERVVMLVDGAGSLCIVRGLSEAELLTHYRKAAKAGDVTTFVLDTAGLLRRLLQRLGEVLASQTEPAP